MGAELAGQLPRLTSGQTTRSTRVQVVDEADRLLNQSYQEWLDKVLQAADPPVSIAASSADVPAGIALRYHADRPDDADSLHLPVREPAAQRTEQP